jgi:PBP1b-binding outer membrane lipoprotein LpoB
MKILIPIILISLLILSGCTKPQTSEPSYTADDVKTLYNNGTGIQYRTTGAETLPEESIPTTTPGSGNASE